MGKEEEKGKRLVFETDEEFLSWLETVPRPRVIQEDILIKGNTIRLDEMPNAKEAKTLRCQTCNSCRWEVYTNVDWTQMWTCADCNAEFPYLLDEVDWIEIKQISKEKE